VGGEIVMGNGPFSIGADGEVRQHDRVLGTLKVVHFDHPELLEAMGNGSYRPGGAHVDPNASATASLRPGFQENSNVNSPEEMVRLTETVRHFEALAHMVQGYDDTMEKTIRKLGEF
jgi:flagellar basal body rod protein FlgG